MKILPLEEIKSALLNVDLLPDIEEAFAAYSNSEAIVPPVGELLFDNPPGEVHIKYGYLCNDDYYVIKIASGFYENPSLGIASNNGLMLLFKKQTGQLEAVLLDEGLLTDVRTAVAGAVAAKHLCPSHVDCIGIVGTGVQANLQLEHLKSVNPCREILVWGRDSNKSENYVSNAKTLGFRATPVENANELLDHCALIVTTTPSSEPILTGVVRPGTHITAVGSDTHNKRELSSSLLGSADIVVADSIEQCLVRGEIHHALSDQTLRKEKLIELGQIISGKSVGRTTDQQISIADLTGVAVQDISIAKSIFESNKNSQP